MYTHHNDDATKTTTTTAATRRRSRKLSVRSQQLISQLYESGTDSGLDSSGEESPSSR